MENRGEALSRINKGIRRGADTLRARIPNEHIFRAKQTAQTTLTDFIKDPERFAPAIDRAGEIIADSSERATDAILQSRQLRMAAEQEDSTRRGCLFYTIKTGIEMVPGGIGPYGIGDALAAIEGISGVEIGVGRRLDKIDRVASFIAAAIPVLPATPLRASFRFARARLEDRVHQRQSAKL